MGRKGTGNHSKQRECVSKPCGEKKHGEEEPRGALCDWIPGTRDELETFVCMSDLSGIQPPLEGLGAP